VCAKYKDIGTAYPYQDILRPILEGKMADGKYLHATGDDIFGRICLTVVVNYHVYALRC
jgi:hypothetical protein